MPSPTVIGAAGRRSAEALMNALAPSHQYRADTVTLSGGNVATIPNRRGADALVMAAGTLAAPTADILLAGAPSVAFTGTQRLASSLPASSWRFLHDGTGFEEFTVYVPTATAPTSIVWSTRTTTTGTTRYFASFYGLATLNGGSNVYSAGAGAVAINNATYSDSSYGSSALPNVMLWNGGALLNSGAQSINPSAGDSEHTFYLGGAGANFSLMRWAETLIFPRVLHEYERQLVREYIAARYGIAAPLLAGVDREILSLLPFSWLDAAVYTHSGGKVTAFLDRARPGHLFSQGTSGNQVVVPSADATFNGAITATFVRTSATHYISSLPGSAWRFLHNGLGMQASALVALVTPATAGTIWATRTSGEGIQVGNSINVWNTYCQNASAGWVILTDPVGSADTAAICLTLRHGTAASPQRSLNKNSVVMASGAYGTTPSNTGPGNTLRIGANGSGGGAGDFRSPGKVFFDRVLNASDAARFSAATLAKYGKAA